MKKQFKNLILSLLVIVGIIFITGCTLPEGPEGGNDRPSEDPITLDVPKNLMVTSGSENKVTWELDKNAVVYVIYIYKDNKLIKSISKNEHFVLDITENGIYQAAIKAIGDGTLYYSSSVSNKVTFEYVSGSSSTLDKLTAPTEVKAIYSNKRLTISFKDSADYTHTSGFKVYVYDGDKLVNIYNLSRNGGYVTVSLDAGTYSVKVAALGDGTNTRDSEQSNENVTFVVEDGHIETEFDFTKYNNYYMNAKGMTGDSLEDALRTIITSTHKKQTSYEDLKTVLQAADRDPNNPNNVITIYSQQSVKGAWDGGATWNREHVWPNSKGVGETGPGADAHHLRPEDPNVNSTRNNYKIDYVTSSSKKQIYFNGSTPTGCYIGGGYFEPADEVKGDIARIYFYLLTRYEDLWNNLASAANFKTLLEWNELDPVSDSEVRRNEEVFKVQGNRNPFIDNADFANLMWA